MVFFLALVNAGALSGGTLPESSIVEGVLLVALTRRRPPPAMPLRVRDRTRLEALESHAARAQDERDVHLAALAVAAQRGPLGAVPVNAGARLGGSRP